MQKTKVLIVDDDKIIRERLKSLLKLESYKAFTAENGIKGIEVFKKELPDIILLDIKMPGMDGSTVLKKIKAIHPAGDNTEIIIITGHGDIQTAIDSLKGGAFGYIQKPVEFDELILELKKAIEKQKLQKKLDKYVKYLEEAINEKDMELQLRKKAEADLKKAIVKAEQASKIKSQFLATMSHEIRTPLNAILGFVDLIRDSQINAKQMRYLNIISSSGKILLNLINDILDISKVEAGEVRLEKIDFSLENLIDSVNNMISIKLRNRPINFKINIEENMPFDFEGDPTRLRQILINLLSNAAKFTNRGDISLSVSVERKLPNKKMILKFEVSDTGVGIPKNKIDTIFEVFTQADMSITRKYGGTGLGLAICRKFVELMGGTIGVKSTVRKGSTFYFKIPLKRKTLISQKKIFPLSIEELKGKNIIIIDNDKHNCEMFNLYCVQYGIKVHTFLSGREALKWMSARNRRADLPNLVLIDIMMPYMNGYDVARNIKADRKFRGIELVAISSIAEIGMSSKMVKSGFSAFLVKPVEKHEMIDVISAVLGDKRTEGQIITRHMAKEISCKGINVLVAEDNNMNKELIKAFLKKLGCNFHIVNNGRLAVNKLKLTRFDVILMDVDMPVMNGIDATRKIRESDMKQKDIPIIALTAVTMKGGERQVIEAGMNDFLQKPIDLNQLKEKVLHWGKF